MKKYLLLLCAALIGFTTSAQVLTSRSYNKEKKATTWFVRVGPSFNNIAGANGLKFDNDYSKCTLGTNTGAAFDLGFNKPIGGAGLYWGMELGVGSRGFSISYTDYVDEESTKSKITTWNVKYSPFIFGYKYSLTDDLKLDAHLGIFASYDFTHKFSTVESNGDKFTEEWYEYTDDFGYDDLDAGLGLGIGVWYKRFNIDLTWQRGFTNLGSGDYYDYKTNEHKDFTGSSSNLILRVGVAF